MDKATEIMLDVMEKMKERFDEAAVKGHFTEMMTYSDKLCAASHAVVELRGSDVNSMLEKVSEIIRDLEPAVLTALT